ncbi:hypothetical protein CVT25_004314 [Psilocybe cyanescens]|uniref:Uncharacterized protein n=1 Tax=Psilocybe cyanescens TaxID=93625 RepID=A0A409XQ48_PSICY|nr:hypothetical protein CVT25_004314 [Psilocybe cyanescens]
MGKSAKVHKRVPKKSKSSTTTATSSAPSASSSRTQVQTSKKHSALKEKAGKGKGSSTTPKGGVLGGADYLSLLMGSRRKIAEEAKKLPKDNIEMVVDS